MLSNANTPRDIRHTWALIKGAKLNLRFFAWVLSVIVATAVTGLVVSHTSSSIGVKLGYIDLTKLMQSYGPAREAQEKIRQQRQEWERNVRTLEEELGRLHNELAQQNDTSAATEKRSQAEEKQVEYFRYTRAIATKAAMLEEETMKPILAKLNSAMQRFGEEQKCSMILGAQSGGNILFAAPPTDLTAAFLDYLSSSDGN